MVSYKDDRLDIGYSDDKFTPTSTNLLKILQIS